MASKRKLMQESKQYLLEKIHHIEERQNWIFSRVQDISASTVDDAKKLLAETDKKKFGKQFKQVNAALETSLSTLMLLTVSFSSCDNDNDSDSSSSTDSEPDSTSHANNNNSSVLSSLSNTDVAKPHRALSSDGSPQNDQPRPAGCDATGGSRARDPRSDTQQYGRGPASTVTVPQATPASSSGDAKFSRSSVQGKDQERSRTAGRPPSKAQTNALLTEDKSRTSSSGTEGLRVPPGLQLPHDFLASTGGKPQEPTQSSKAPSEHKSGPRTQEHRSHQNSHEKKVPSDGLNQPDGSGDAQLKVSSPTPPEASTSPAPSSLQAVPPPTPPSRSPVSPQLPTQVQPHPVSYRISREKQGAVIMPFELKAKGQVEVVVSHVMSPAIFWIQLADCPMGSFSQKLNEFYSSHPDIPIPAPYLGIFCCACFTEDNCWYRARIVGVHGQVPDQPSNLDDPTGVRVDVIYVDYGNRERLSLARVRVIYPDFTRLQAQTVCCSLAKVKPPDMANGWLKEQTHFFRALVLGKMVQATVTTQKEHRCPLLDMSVPGVPNQAFSEARQCVHIDVAQAMVERYMAQYVAGCGPPEVPLQPRQCEPPTSKPPAGASVDPSPLGNTAEMKSVGAGVPGPRDTGQPVPVKAEGAPLKHSDTKNHKPQRSEDAISGDGSTSRTSAGKDETPSNNQGLSGSNQDKLTESGSKCSIKTASKQAPPDKSLPTETTNRAPVSPPSQGSLLHSGKILDRSNNSQAGSARRQGSWSGRGSRLNNPRRATQPPKKTEPQTRQGSKSTDRGVRDGPTDPQLKRETNSRVPKPREDVTSQEQYKDVEEESVKPTTDKKPKDDMTDTSSLHVELDKFPDAIGCGRMISPKSSSGVSSCNSGQSDLSGLRKTARSVRPEKEATRSDDSIPEQCILANAETDLKGIITKMCSGDSEPKPPDYNGTPDRELKQAKDVSMVDLNKSLSHSSKNLSSSTCSFHTAVTEVDSFQTSGSSCRKSKVAPISKDTPPSGSLKTENRHTVESPPCRDLQLSKRDNLPMQNGCVRLAMSHIVSPQEFYVHLVTPDATKLDYLAEELNSFYDGEKADDMSKELTPGPGAYCAARYTGDGDWYRAQILAVRDSKDAQLTEGCDSAKNVRAKEVQVMYIDFGNKEWQSAAAVRPLEALFYELPAQVIKCCLDHISPPEKEENPEREAAKSELGNPSGSKEVKGGWSGDIVREFAALTGYKKLLLGRLTREYEPNSDEPLRMILLDPTNPLEVCINQELVNHGLASSTRFVPAKPQGEFISGSEEYTERQFSMAAERWHLKKYMEGGYDPVPERSKEEGHPEGGATLTNKWNPMRTDFESNRNSYDIDTDDPGVATLGYKAESTRQLCRYFSSGRVCYRGNQCPYEHAKIGEKPLMSVDVYCSNDRVRLPPRDSMVALEVTALFDAFHFWAQLPYFARPLDVLQQQGAPPLEDDDGSEETLESLEESLNGTYSASKHRQASSLLLRAQGEMVCCRCPQDQRYYRARVIEVDSTQDTIQVFYVDYGNTDWVPSSNVHDILPQFLHLPLQAVECRLAGARPLDYSAEAEARPDEARTLFEELACNKTLVAHIVYVSCSGTLDVELFDTNGKSDVNVGEALIENGLAVREGQRSCDDPSLSSKGRRSEDECYCSSETSSGVVIVPG